jgi:outer membrane receptor protein involved in Fe transport
MTTRLLVLSLVLISAAFAQVGSGTIRGTVLDNTQAAIPNAQVTVTHVQTNIPRQTTTTSSGIFSVPALPPGEYTLAVEFQGFKRWTGSLDLQVGQTAAVNVVMEVGSVDTVVEVSGAAPIIATESSEVADVKDSLRISQLPLNGRNITNLFTLSPGVEGTANPRVNGLKVGATEMMLDGISLVDRFGGGMARVQPGLDTIEEFRIETLGSRAEHSRPATVTLVTKSGTNELHGSLFETHRNNTGGLRARQRQDGNTSAKLVRNEYGASAGGPVYIPKLYNGKNKTFWFFAYEGLRQRQSQFYRAAVPTAEMWEGNFSRVIDANGRQTNIYDPMTTAPDGTRTQFAGNIIPRERLSPFFAAMRDISPLPTNAVNPFVGSNFETLYPNRNNVYKLTGKGDHRLTDKDSLTGRLSVSSSATQRLGGVFSAPPVGMENGYGSGRQNVKVYNASVRHTRTFTPSVLNELTLGVQRSNNSNGTLADNTPWANDLGLPNPFGALGWPTMYADDFGWDGDNRKDEKLTGYVIEDALSWTTGKHSFRFGGKFRWEQNNVRELQQAQGSHSFNGNWTGLYDPSGDLRVSFTGNGLADMALGLPGQLTNQQNRGYFYFRQNETGLFVQDTWRVSSRLTLDLGVRWDRWSPYTEAQNRFTQIDPLSIPTAFQVVTPGNVTMEEIPGILPSQLASYARRGLTWTTAEAAGMPSELLRADNNNFAPRLGVAYRLTGRTSLRANYGEYYWTMPLSQILQSMRINPPLNLRYTNDVDRFDGTSNFGVRNAPRPDFFIGRATVDTAGIVNISSAPQSGFLLDGRNWKDSRAQSWHFTIEHELMADTALRLSYLGDRSSNLEQRYSANPREAEYNYVARTGMNPPGNRDLMRVNKDWTLTGLNRTGFANTHSVQAEVERRYSNGVAFQVYYVFTRALTTSDADGFTSGGTSINATNGGGQVPETIEILGAPNMTYDERLRLVYYNSGAIPAHRVSWNGLYELPFGRGKRFGRDASGVLNHVIGGWNLTSIGQWRSGLWRSVAAGRYLFGDPGLDADERLLLTFGGRPQRLWFRGDFDVTRATNVDQARLQELIPIDRGQRVVRQLGPNVDNRLPLTLRDGTTRLTPITDTVNWNARNFFRGPGSWGIDLTVNKNFAITERTQLRFGADFFNVLNHPIDTNPDATTGLQDLSIQDNDPRIIQLSLRFSW